MTEFFDYVVCVDKNSGGNDVHLCYAPFMSFIEVGDIVVINPPDSFKDMLLKKEDSALNEKGNVVGLYAPYDCITSTDIEDLQCKVKDEFQSNAIWIMHPETREALRTLKDSVGRYLLMQDYNITGGFSNYLLGKPVYVSDSMPKMATGKTAIYYGDMGGLVTKFAENMNIQVLREKFADEHADGVVGWFEFDAKVENAQKIAKLVMKS